MNETITISNEARQAAEESSIMAAAVKRYEHGKVENGCCSVARCKGGKDRMYLGIPLCDDHIERIRGERFGSQFPDADDLFCDITPPQRRVLRVLADFTNAAAKDPERDTVVIDHHVTVDRIAAKTGLSFKAVGRVIDFLRKNECVERIAALGDELEAIPDGCPKYLIRLAVRGVRFLQTEDRLGDVMLCELGGLKTIPLNAADQPGHTAYRIAAEGQPEITKATRVYKDKGGKKIATRDVTDRIEKAAGKKKKKNPASAKKGSRLDKARKAATAAQVKQAKAGSMTMLEAAAAVLEGSDDPLNCKAMIGLMTERGLWNSPGGATPHATLSASIGREMKKGDASKFRFRKVSPGLYRHG